jgi:hypothetical protein
MKDENEKKKLYAFYIKYTSHFYSIGFEFNVIWIQLIFQLNIFELNWIPIQVVCNGIQYFYLSGA